MSQDFQKVMSREGEGEHLAGPDEDKSIAFPCNTDEDLARLFSRYSKSRRPVAVSFRQLVPWLKVGERATHYLHPYPAKLLPQIAHFFLSSDLLCPPTGIVLDPFGGSGTVSLEARLSGRKALYADCNPFARLLAEAKLHLVSRQAMTGVLARVHARVVDAPNDLVPPPVVNIRHWYADSVIADLVKLKYAIDHERNQAVHRLLQITFSAVARRVSRADPRLSVPVRMKVGEQRKASIKNGTVWEAFERQFLANKRRLEELATLMPQGGDFEVAGTDARQLRMPSGREIDSNSIHLVLTSPPYAGAQKYVRATSLSLGWLGMAGSGELKPLENQTIGREHLPSTFISGMPTTRLRSANRVIDRVRAINPSRAAICAMYLAEMDGALEEAARVLVPYGYLVVVVGNNKVCGHDFKSSKYLVELAEKHGLVVRLRLIDEIKSRGLMTKRNKTASVITREWVLVFQKAR